MAGDPLEHEFLEVRSRAGYNREVFLLNFATELRAFEGIDSAYSLLARVPAQFRNADGKTRPTFTLFLQLIQRQSHLALDLLSGYQSYSAWVLLRPAIEAALIMGKWVHDPEMAQVWKNRSEDPKRFQKHYQGKSLESEALPNSPSLRSMLSKVNDLFIHPNPEYLFRHVKMEEQPDRYRLAYEYFDQAHETRAHLYSFLHVLSIMHDSVGQMFESHYPDFTFSLKQHTKTRTGLEPRVDALLGEYPDLSAVLDDLGLWRVVPN